MSTQELQAIALLGVVNHPAVYFLLANGERLVLSPAQTISRLRHGGYDVKLRAKRVRWIRIASRPAVWLPCWRTTRAATLWEPSWGEMET